MAKRQGRGIAIVVQLFPIRSSEAVCAISCSFQSLLCSSFVMADALRNRTRHRHVGSRLCQGGRKWEVAHRGRNRGGFGWAANEEGQQQNPLTGASVAGAGAGDGAQGPAHANYEAPVRAAAGGTKTGAKGNRAAPGGGRADERTADGYLASRVDQRDAMPCRAGGEGGHGEL